MLAAKITLEGRPKLVPRPVIVPADPSSAAFLIVAALITPGSEVVIEGMMMNPLRIGLMTTLIEMGRHRRTRQARRRRRKRRRPACAPAR